MRKTKFMLSIILLLVGCSSQVDESENIDFDEPIIVEEKYEFVHGVVNYQFEKWSFKDEPLNFDYEIKNIGLEAEFGLVFLIDGLPQTYEVDGQMTNMYKVILETDKETKVSISMIPKVLTNSNETNINAFVVLNPSTQIDDVKKYKMNHAISSTATIRLILEEHQYNTDFEIKKIGTDFEPISEEVLEKFREIDATMLGENAYIEADDDILFVSSMANFSLNAYGKPGHYRLLTVEDNVITDASEIEIKEETYTKISLNLELEDVTNLYFLLVPLDVQDVHGYLMMSQSNRWIVE